MNERQVSNEQRELSHDQWYAKGGKDDIYMFEYLSTHLV